MFDKCGSCVVQQIVLLEIQFFNASVREQEELGELVASYLSDSVVRQVNALDSS